MRTLLPALLACAALPLAVGCGAGDEHGDYPAVRWQSEHIQYATRPGDEATCPDIVPLLEEHRAFWRAFLAVPGPGGRILYRKYRDPEDLRKNGDCARIGAACVDGTTVHSPVPFDAHELVHAYLGEISEPPDPLFAEGAAVAFSCEGRLTFVLSETPPWQELVGLAENDPNFLLMYMFGGKLVTHLVRTFGPERFLPFYRSLAGTKDARTIGERFAATFGVSLDEVWKNVKVDDLESPPCLRAWECAAPPIVVGGGWQSLAETCGFGGDWRTFELRADANVVLSSRAMQAGELHACSGAAVGRDRFSPSLGNGRLLADLPRGVYRLKFRGAAEIDVGVAPAPSIGRRCGELSRYEVGPDTPFPLTIAAPHNWDHRIFVKLRFATPVDGRLRVVTHEGDSAVAAAICESCASAPGGCRKLGADSLDAVFTGDTLLTIEGTRPWFELDLDRRSPAASR